MVSASFERERDFQLDKDPEEGEIPTYLPSQSIYFAHSMQIYGTEEERDELEQLGKRYPNSSIINPATDVRPKRKHEAELSRFFDSIRDCALVIVLEHQKSVGRGVFREVCYALAVDKSILVKRGFRYYPVFGIHVKNVSDWKIHYGELEV